MSFRIPFLQRRSGKMSPVSSSLWAGFVFILCSFVWFGFFDAHIKSSGYAPEDQEALKGAAGLLYVLGSGGAFFFILYRLFRRQSAIMADLREARDELEQRVIARTAALTEANRALEAEVARRKQAEEDILGLNGRLESRAAQLEAANRELEAFSYSVSHDLRAPLRSIDGFSKTLIDEHGGALDEKGKNRLERVRAAAQRMGGLIDGLLNLSTLSRVSVRAEPIQLSVMAHNIAAELRESAPERAAVIRIEPNLAATGDPQLLHNVLDNLLRNAWKFTRLREEAVIEFGASVADGKTIFFVKDNGVGFNMAYAPKLFGAFQRLHSNAEFEGTGIGLATCQRIVQRHGGRIWAESELGKGSVFFFTLASRDA